VKDRRPLALLVLALALGGCLEAEETVTFHADGTGALRQRFTTHVAAREALLEGVFALAGAASPAPFADPVGPRWLEAVAARTPGYTLRGLTVEDGAGARTVLAEAAFDDLEAAARAGAFLADSVRLDDLGVRGWRLQLEAGWGRWLRAHDGRIGARPAQEVLDRLASALERWSVRRTFVFPSAVLETDGDLGEDGRTVRWRIDPRSLRTGGGLTLTVVFERGDGLALTPFRWEPDDDEVVRRFLEAPRGPPIAPPRADSPGTGAQGKDGGR
jgi:hypothetical protein